jgi:uncharacterized protein
VRGLPARDEDMNRGSYRRRWQRAVVTGASSGIGEAIARRLAAEGVDLVVVSRRRETLERLAVVLRAEHGVAVEVVESDLSSPVSRAAVERLLADDEVPVDLLVNCAGFGTSGSFAGLAVAQEDQEVQLNVLAPLRLTSAAVPAMVRRGTGNVVNISSMAALYPMPGSATYAATKAFLCSWGDALHEELRGSGVVVTTSLPGFTRTRFHERSGSPARVPGWAWSTAAAVADRTLEAAIAGRARVVPGLGYRLLAALSAPIPPGARRRLLGRLSAWRG